LTAPRILVVDDEPNIRDLLITSLRFAGFQVRAVSNGAQTISAVRVMFAGRTVSPAVYTNRSFPQII
jgi:CheY-like chemotaxis protein